MQLLKTIHLAGWKSIRESQIELRSLNVLIGPNGGGKSNLVAFFQMLGQLVEGRFQEYIARSGGAKSLLHFGPKITQQIEAELDFDTSTGSAHSAFQLRPSPDDSFVITNQRFVLQRQGETVECVWAGYHESYLKLEADKGMPEAQMAYQLLKNCRVFHFHDTSDSARIRQPAYIEANRRLDSDAGNLAAMLYLYRETRPTIYRRIVGTIRQFAPFLDDFILEPRRLNPKEIILNWRTRGSDYELGPHQLSDGTLRALALTTLLLQPEDELPALIVLDEPELGLHPGAIGVLASLLQKATQHSQVLIATQSTTLLDHFDLEDVIVARLRDGRSVFERLDAKEFEEWRREYTVSELWEKNVIGGGPY